MAKNYVEIYGQNVAINYGFVSFGEKQAYRLGPRLPYIWEVVGSNPHILLNLSPCQAGLDSFMQKRKGYFVSFLLVSSLTICGWIQQENGVDYLYIAVALLGENVPLKWYISTYSNARAARESSQYPLVEWKNENCTSKLESNLMFRQEEKGLKFVIDPY